MGGCRCTYRNCSVKSDGKTHMFHYPVFDKARCHQWLINAQRLEFLNLKVSQVRNRVVCQHHFRDECFMNYKKGKLTFDAVPTEDGPFTVRDECNNSESNPHFPINLNEPVKDVEPILSIDKKANVSMKYADFLLKPEVVEDKQNLTEKYVIIPPKVPKKQTHVSMRQLKAFQSLIKRDITKIPENEPLPTNDINLEKTTEFPEQANLRINNNVEKVKQIEDANNVLMNQVPNNMIISIDEFQEPNNIVIESGSNIMPIPAVNTVYHVQPLYIVPADYETKSDVKNQQALGYSYRQPFSQQYSRNMEQIPLINSNSMNISNATVHNKTSPRVKILSEKTISDPIPVTGKLDPVSPSFILPLPNRKKEIEHCETINPSNRVEVFTHETAFESAIGQQQESSINIGVEPTSIKSEAMNIGDLNNCKNVTIQEVSLNEVKTQKDMFIKSLENSQIIRSNNNTIENSPKISILKHKIPPERIAAIEQKRNFNKKLRDMIESCLENTEEREKVKQGHSVIKTKDADSNLQQNIGSFLSKDSMLPNVQEYTVAYLEARMKKMENLLSQKIEQNSQNIVELKHSIAPIPQKFHTTSTQTPYSEESYKKYLYQEISKFLSPSANSLLYEELFINKFGHNASEQPCPKRKKHR